jgi:hypothetical protein
MTGVVIKLSERKICPDMDKVFAMIDMAEGDDSKLFGIAMLAFNGADFHRHNERTADHLQGLVDGMAIAAFALLTILGMPRDALD